MVAVTGDGFESVMRGIAAVVWPVVAIVIVLTFKSEIADLLRRLRRGRLLGQEIELDKSLDELERGAQQLASKPLPRVDASNPADAGPARGASSTVEAQTQDILDLAAQSPKAALMQLSATIEREARRLLAATGHADEVPGPASLRAMVEVLERATALQRGTLDVVRNFAEVRNRIVHGHQGTPDDEVLRAIDAGLIILRALATAPRERNVVYHPGVTLYSNADATETVAGARGVILETTSAGGAMKSLRIFPTTRTHFERGREVAWEWNSERSWGSTWYRHPDTGGVEQAWDGSLEFIGRHLDEI